jgi:hypothetical protein
MTVKIGSTILYCCLDEMGERGWMREEEGRERVAEDDGFLNGVGGEKSWQILFTLLEDEGKKK